MIVCVDEISSAERVSSIVGDCGASRLIVISSHRYGGAFLSRIPRAQRTGLSAVFRLWRDSRNFLACHQANDNERTRSPRFYLYRLELLLLE